MIGRKTALADTSFWFALFNKSDSNHESALTMVELIDKVELIVPWPTLYETLNTWFVNRWMLQFDPLIKRPNVRHLDDAPYRTRAIALILQERTRPRGRQFSLVDAILRLIIANTNVRVDSLLTFDRRDFADICLQRRVELLPR